MPASRAPFAFLVTAVVALAGLTACAQEPESDGEPVPADTTAVDIAALPPAEAGVVEIAAVDYAFRGPDSIPSGWTTFRMDNEGREHHLLVLWKMPGDQGVEEYVEGVVEPFGVAYDSLMAGSVDMDGFWGLFGGGLAPWSADIVPMGGPGLIAPGETARTTVKLEPGTYVLECYVRTPDGEWHTDLGMLAEMVVTDDETGASPPEADLEVTLSNTAIAAPGSLAAGERTFAVRYEEHPEVGLGNDVHLARLEEGDTVEEAVAWTDWRTAEGLREPAPVAFLGGAQEMPVGHTSYFTVDLEPGRYLLVSEATAPDEKVSELTVE